MIKNNKTFALFILLVSIIAGCDLSSAPELDKIEIEPLFKGEAATIEFAPTVDDSTKSHIVSFVSFGDSISTIGSGKIPSIDGLPFATFAINDKGETILGAIVKPNTVNKIDQSSTAELLINLIIPPGINAFVSQSAISESIKNHPNFAGLVEEIRVKATFGVPLSNSIDAIKTAILIADDIVINYLEIENKNKSLTIVNNQETESSLARFAVAKDIQIESEPRVGLGGTVKFSNNSYAPFLIDISSVAKPLNLSFKSLCFICFSPGVTINSASIEIPYDGSLSFTARVDKDTIVMQLVLDMYSLTMNALGLRIPKTEQTLATAYAFINRAGILSSILQKGSASDVAKAAADEVLGSTAAFIVDVLEKNPEIIAKAGFSATINTFIPIFKAINGAELTTKIVLQGHATYQYWNMKPEKADACFEDGKLYGGCSHRVVIEPDTVTLKLKESVYLTATVYDDKNRILVGRKVDWLSSAPEVVSLLHKKADLNFATSHRAGMAKITAESGEKKGYSELTVEDPCEEISWIYGRWVAVEGYQERFGYNWSQLPFLTSPGPFGNVPSKIINTSFTLSQGASTDAFLTGSIEWHGTKIDGTGQHAIGGEETNINSITNHEANIRVSCRIVNDSVKIDFSTVLSKSTIVWPYTGELLVDNRLNNITLWENGFETNTIQAELRYYPRIDFALTRMIFKKDS